MATIAQPDECQKKYTEARDQAIGLTKRIQAALRKQPTDPKGNWAMVGTMRHYQAELQEISDALYTEGEYAE